ncbi:hypothetical protein Sjap_004861 [Stephania japonica]|uniref:FAD-binding FR-type domain-containing protein n=1 Tax=Stephania japonica TaxID=461633 RepID=A0AAP0K314_9MAGN
MWVLEPAKISHKSWQEYLRTKVNLNSTYFGGQGTNLLLYTFPIMFIATFSCLYFHLGKEFESQIASRSSIIVSSLRRPVLVKAPLGIVNTTELVFSALFVVLLIWSFFGYIILYPPWKEKWEDKVGLMAYILGCLGNICLAFLFFPVTRGSSILPLVGLTSESSIKYHIWLGHISMVLFTLHSVGYIAYFALVHEMAELLEWSRDSISNVAGEIVFVFCLAMWLTSIARVRTKMFELFFYTHQLYALYIFFFVLHVGIAYSCMILPGIFLFLIDRYLRFLQSRNKAQLVSAHILPCEAVELHVSKCPGLLYAPMSIMFINVSSISKLQWHPFTVTSDCNVETDKLSILIKCEGNWSRALYKTLSLPSPMEQLCVSVEGPYGPTSLPFLRYDSLVMVSGGSGLAAFIPIIKDIVYKSTTKVYLTQQILLICAFRRTVDLSMLDLLLPIDTNIPP